MGENFSEGAAKLDASDKFRRSHLIIRFKINMHLRKENGMALSEIRQYAHLFGIAPLVGKSTRFCHAGLIAPRY